MAELKCHNGKGGWPCICDACVPPRPRTAESCGMCSEQRDDVDEYTGAPGPLCSDCYEQWRLDDREAQQW